MTILEKTIETIPLPDTLFRFAIKAQLKSRLKIERRKRERYSLTDYAVNLRNQDITIDIKKANDQHYEVPTDFYNLVLGPYKKYSCGLWRKDTRTLADAEINMLELYIKRAEIMDGQQILDLGCGWGSFSLYIGERFPNINITALSNSKTQKEYMKPKQKNETLNH